MSSSGSDRSTLPWGIVVLVAGLATLVASGAVIRVVINGRKKMEPPVAAKPAAPRPRETPPPPRISSPRPAPPAEPARENPADKPAERVTATKTLTRLIAMLKSTSTDIDDSDREAIVRVLATHSKDSIPMLEGAVQSETDANGRAALTTHLEAVRAKALESQKAREVAERP